MSTVIRFTWTIVLLVEVWFHAHWSVALLLSLFAINNEIAAFTVGKLLKKFSIVRK